jgi:hypothetical protein
MRIKEVTHGPIDSGHHGREFSRSLPYQSRRESVRDCPVDSLWRAITSRFKGKAAAEEAVKDLVAQPADGDNQAAFRKELRKVLESDPTFAAECEHLLTSAQQEAGDTIVNTGSGAIAARGGVAAGASGAAVKGDVHGNITIGRSEKKE